MNIPKTGRRMNFISKCAQVQPTIPNDAIIKMKVKEVQTSLLPGETRITSLPPTQMSKGKKNRLKKAENRKQNGYSDYSLLSYQISTDS